MKATVFITLILTIMLLMSAFACATHSPIIPDLAYVRAVYGTYSNDADPEPDAIGITVLFYNTKSEQISFKGIPIKVTVDLYAWPLEEGEQFPADDQPKKAIYQKHFTIDSSRGMGVGAEEPMSIQFDDIEKASPGRYFRGCIAGYFIPQVTLETPEQGVFTAE